jgi:hypothetical protein
MPWREHSFFFLQLRVCLPYSYVCARDTVTCMSLDSAEICEICPAWPAMHGPETSALLHAETSK